MSNRERRRSVSGASGAGVIFGGENMSAEPTRCSKCNGEMVQGFLFESEGHKLTTWVEGAPEKSWWGGATVPKEKCVPVGTFRCLVCGFLESYARPEFGTQ
jgi:hypothetical protein